MVSIKFTNKLARFLFYHRGNGLGIAMEILFCEELEEEKDWNGNEVVARPEG